LRTFKLAAVSAAVILALTACGNQSTAAGDTPAAAAPTTAAPDPAARLTAATGKMTDLSYRFTMTVPDGSVEGVRHAPSNSTRMTLTAEVDGETGGFDMIQIGDDVWFKLILDLGGDAESKEMAAELSKWTKVSADEAKQQSGVSGLSEVATMFNNAAFADMAELKETAPGTLTGAIDLTKPGLDVLDADEIKKLGDRAKSVPITIILDGEDRLTSMSFEIPSSEGTGTEKIEMKFSDFDKVEQPKAPPADEVRER